MMPIDCDCDTCGAVPTKPCRQVGPGGGQGGKVPAAEKLGPEMVTFHAARRRAALIVKLANGAEVHTLHDKYSGQQISLTVRDGLVTGAVGSDPQRYIGLNLDFAKRYARNGGKR